MESHEDHIHRRSTHGTNSNWLQALSQARTHSIDIREHSMEWCISHSATGRLYGCASRTLQHYQLYMWNTNLLLTHLDEVIVTAALRQASDVEIGTTELTGRSARHGDTTTQIGRLQREREREREREIFKKSYIHVSQLSLLYHSSPRNQETFQI